jgi:DNA-binding transcriptional LysR family regulator
MVLSVSAHRLASIDLNLLVALDALLAERSVTRAAARVALTQPAMSRTLSRLRELLGDPLLVRTPRGMQLTARGELMIEPVRHALEAIDRAIVQPVAFEPARAKRRFIVATSDYVQSVLLPGALRRLTREAPHVEIQVRPVFGELARLLESDRADLVIGVVFDGAAGFYRQALFRDRLVCVVRKDHPRVGSSMDLDLYLDLPHLLIAPRGRRGGIVDDELERRGLSRRVAVRLPYYLAAPHVVAQSDLCLTLAERVARAACETLPLRQLEVPLQLPEMVVTQFWHARANDDPAHVWLRSTMFDAASTDV